MSRSRAHLLADDRPRESGGGVAFAQAPSDDTGPSGGGVWSGMVMLFTAFEPSGDEHAAPVIAELKRRHPELRIYAWGGPKMAAAGAEIVERTGDDAVMGMPGLQKIREHQAINKRIEKWLQSRIVAVHVPVDSPAANFPICELTKRHGARVVHMVAPQIWAWGRWRIHKLRRLTDMVLCLLPFEQRFFERRRVPARFIGHPVFERVLDTRKLAEQRATLPDASPRIAMFPGSRPDELRRNFPVMLETFEQIRARYPRSAGILVATTERTRDVLKQMAGGAWPRGMDVRVAQTDAVVSWADIAIVKSGTVTLQVTHQRRPMVIFYKKSNPFFYALIRVILATKKFSLPNLIAGREVVPELIPYWGGHTRLTRAVLKLLASDEEKARQASDLDAVVRQFDGLRPATMAADAILEIAARARA